MTLPGLLRASDTRATSASVLLPGPVRAWGVMRQALQKRLTLSAT